MLRVWCLIGLLLTFVVPAKAATTVFGSSVYATSGTVTNAARALGAADGSRATIARNAVLTVLMPYPITGRSVKVTGVKASGGTTVQVSLGVLVAGTPVYTISKNFPGLSGVRTFDFAAGCKALSTTGCTLMRFRVVGNASASFGLDGVAGVTPEPSAWALMILAFMAIAWRLKGVRRNSPQILSFA